MPTTVDPAIPRKLGLRPGMRVLVLGAPQGYPEGLGAAEPGLALEVPGDATHAIPGQGTPVDAVQLFCRDRAELERLGPQALAATRPGGLVWVCYPKGTSGIRTDLGRDIEWTPFTAAGFRIVSAVSIDDTWSALRFRHATEVGR